MERGGGESAYLVHERLYVLPQLVLSLHDWEGFVQPRGRGSPHVSNQVRQVLVGLQLDPALPRLVIHCRFLRVSRTGLHGNLKRKEKEPRRSEPQKMRTLQRKKRKEKKEKAKDALARRRGGIAFFLLSNWTDIN